MILGGCCFVVFSEASGLFKFPVSSLDKKWMTSCDINMLRDLAAYLGVRLTQDTNDLWRFVESIRSRPYDRSVQDSARYTIEYFYPHDVHYKVGSECRLLMCYAIRPSQESTVKNLIDVHDPIVYGCDKYFIYKYLHLKRNVEPPAQSGFVLDQNDFPSL